MKTIVVHDGIFHPDDVCATATLQLLLESKGEEGFVIRTRDESIIKTADYVCDVGSVFDPATNRFDHHQLGGAGMRSNGIQYASFGLVWKTYGLELCRNNQWVVDFIDKKLVAGIDGPDNGQMVREKKYEDVSTYEFNDWVASFLPTWTESTTEDALLRKFNEVVQIAKNIIAREIKKSQDIFSAEIEIEKIYHATVDKRIIILDQYLPWKKKIESFPEPLLCIFPDNIVNRWIVYCVLDDCTTRSGRMMFPESWAGLRNEELAVITGVTDALFCHRGRFLAVAKSKEGAVALARLALITKY